MGTAMLCLFFLYLHSSSSISPISASTNQSPINVWPKPITFSWSRPNSIPLSPKFTITSPQHRYLTPAVNRYLRQVLTEHHRPLVAPAVNLSLDSPLRTLAVAVADLDAPLHHGVNESYTLAVPAGGGEASLTAGTVWGAMRGLETFSQIVWGYPTRVAAGVYVSDSPIFGHRGLTLDTSRNYFGVEDILRTIGAMSANKMNVFHWHVTDSHSFPLVLPSEPDLARKGSYGPGMQYSPEDVKRVVEFGLEHGVRVLPEIDMPGELDSDHCFISVPLFRYDHSKVSTCK